MYRMVQSTPVGARDDLLERALAHVAEAGVGDASLRALAEGMGTSHRMLIYHFGSKDGLLVAIATEVERRQLAALADLDVSGPPDEVMRAMWARLADPALAPFERLFFELYARGLQGDPGASPFLAGIVDSWVEPIVAVRVADGADEAAARAEARLGLAVFRGLLLDLLATGDRAGVDAAVERFVDLAALALRTGAQEDP
jgi:AcrR family transcriptional regulator